MKEMCVMCITLSLFLVTFTQEAAAQTLEVEPSKVENPTPEKDKTVEEPSFWDTGVGTGLRSGTTLLTSLGMGFGFGIGGLVGGFILDSAISDHCEFYLAGPDDGKNEKCRFIGRDIGLNVGIATGAILSTTLFGYVMGAEDGSVGWTVLLTGASLVAAELLYLPFDIDPATKFQLSIGLAATTAVVTWEVTNHLRRNRTRSKQPKMVFGIAPNQDGMGAFISSTF